MSKNTGGSRRRKYWKTCVVPLCRLKQCVDLHMYRHALRFAVANARQYSNDEREKGQYHIKTTCKSQCLRKTGGSRRRQRLENMWFPCVSPDM